MESLEGVPPKKKARGEEFGHTTSLAVQAFEDKADVEVEIEGTTLKVHSLILGLASPVFAALLCSNMQEGLSRRIKLPDKSKHEFELFMS